MCIHVRQSCVGWLKHYNILDFTSSQFVLTSYDIRLERYGLQSECSWKLENQSESWRNIKFHHEFEVLSSSRHQTRLEQISGVLFWEDILNLWWLINVQYIHYRVICHRDKLLNWCQLRNLENLIHLFKYSRLTPTYKPKQCLVTEPNVEYYPDHIFESC